MTDWPAPIARMLDDRKLERVTPNGAHAEEVLAQAEQHVSTARLIAASSANATDVAEAIAAASDIVAACREDVSVHLTERL